MKKNLTLFLLLTYSICNGQNLVLNGDFEQYWSCPDYQSELDSAKFWINPTMADPDYYNQCAPVSNNVNVPDNWLGFQQAHSGVAYAGLETFYYFLPNYREYIEVPLSSSLITGQYYHFEMYISLANVSKYTSHTIGVYFSDTLIDAISNTLPLPFIPQINNASGNIPDSLNWTLVSGNYTATGGESYLIIGNFSNSSSTDTLLVNPSSSSPISYVYIDDVSLTIYGTGIAEQNETSISIFPNPITDKLNIQINNYEPTEIILYDISSRKLLQQTFTNSISVNTEKFANGVYLYEVRNKKGVLKSGKFIKE